MEDEEEIDLWSEDDFYDVEDDEDDIYEVMGDGGSGG